MFSVSSTDHDGSYDAAWYDVDAAGQDRCSECGRKGHKQDRCKTCLGQVFFHAESMGV